MPVKYIWIKNVRSLVIGPSFESAYAENRAVTRADVKVREGLDLDLACSFHV